jgi:hypothetical protein
MSFQEFLNCKYCHVHEFGVIIGFIEHLQIVITRNYSSIANSHALEFNLLNLLSSPVIVWRCLCFRAHVLMAGYCPRLTQFSNCPGYISARTTLKTPFLCCCFQLLPLKHACLRSRYSVTAVLYFYISRSLPSNGSTCHIMLSILDTFLLNSFCCSLSKSSIIALILLEMMLVYYLYAARSELVPPHCSQVSLLPLSF